VKATSVEVLKMKSEASVALPLRAVALFLGAVLVAVTMFSTTAQAQPNSAPLGAPIPVEGTLSDGGSFEGVIKNGKVTVQGGQAFLSGTLKGTATLADGTTERVTQQFSGVPADVTSAQQNSCQILFLDLGPIFLDLLGLQVDLSEITLDITAVRGPGNLLCGLVGIFD
jgi:hypothetical protein